MKQTDYNKAYEEAISMLLDLFSLEAVHSLLERSYGKDIIDRVVANLRNSKFEQFYIAHHNLVNAQYLEATHIKKLKHYIADLPKEYRAKAIQMNVYRDQL